MSAQVTTHVLHAAAQPAPPRDARHHVAVGERPDVELTLSPGEFCAAVCCLQHRAAITGDAIARMLAAELLDAVGHPVTRPARYLSAWLDGAVSVSLSAAMAGVLADAVSAYAAAVPDSPLLRLAARVLTACDAAAALPAASGVLPDAFPLLDRFALVHTRVTGAYSDRVSLAVADELSQRRAGGYPTAHLDLIVQAPQRPIYEVSVLVAMAHFPGRVHPEYELLYRGRELDQVAQAVRGASHRDAAHAFEVSWRGAARLGYPLADPEQITPWEIAGLTRTATRQLAPEHAQAALASVDAHGGATLSA
jgi:hypothetical protein